MNTKVTNWLKGHPLPAFFILAYAISWGIEIPLALKTRGVTLVNIPSSLHYLAGYGPMVAALLMTGVTTGKSGLKDLIRRLTKFRVKPIWWLIAFSPLGIFLVASIVQSSQLHWRLYKPNEPGLAYLGGLAYWVLNGQWNDLLTLGWVDFLPGLGLAALPMWLLTFGVGEETGWRGYALPRLQKGRSPLSATIILWAFWAFWHAPMFLYSYELSTLPGFLVGLLAGAITFTWLYNSTGGSILLVALFHGVFNFVTACIACKSGLAAPIVSIAVMVWAVLLVIHYQQTKSQSVGKEAFSTRH